MINRIVIYLHFCDNRIDSLDISLGASVPGRAATLVVAVAFWGS
jgi:hypothetical protein